VAYASWIQEKNSLGNKNLVVSTSTSTQNWYFSTTQVRCKYQVEQVYTQKPLFTINTEVAWKRIKDKEEKRLNKQSILQHWNLSNTPNSHMRMTWWSSSTKHIITGRKLYIKSMARGYAYAKMEYVCIFRKIEYAYGTFRTQIMNSPIRNITGRST